MATPEEGRPPVGRKGDRKKRLTVMLMGEVGRTRSFQVSPRLLLWGTLFMAAYILLSLFTINRYLELRRTVISQQEEIGRIEEENASNRKSLLRARQHVALLEDYVRRSEERPEEPPSPGKAASTREGSGIALSPGTPRPGEEKPSGDSGIVDVVDMVIQREGSKMKVSFKLVNTQQGDAAAGGYVHLIALDGKSSPAKEWPYPQQTLERGVPANYRKGHVFYIQRFKQISARFNLGSPSESPTVIKVLAYDQAGELILEKHLEVGHDS
ncbi:MAG: hypothetical protein JXL84_04855 [Deltaproteobacteria bacterium]|nr:hypothetical protein [Deltaproteobacteria bacterium]